MSSMKYPYRDLGVPFDRNFRNDLNANFDDIEHDIRMIGGEAAQQALEAAEEANTQAIYAQTSGDYANDKGDYAAQQGDYAQTQGNFANEKGLYAQQQGDYAKAQGDYAKQVGDENKTRWLNPVATFADIATTYPNPQHGDTVMVTDDGQNSGSVYRYENGQWNLTQKHNDLAIADVQNKIGILSSIRDFVEYGKIKLPSDFPKTLPFDLYRDSDGIIKHNFDISKEIKGTEIFVNEETGNDANDGLTSGTAVRTLNKAIELANAVAGTDAIINITNRIMSRNYSGTSAFTLNKNLTIRAYNPYNETILANSEYHTALTWIADGTAYKATRSSVLYVADVLYKDYRGIPKLLKKVNSVAECQAEKGTWYTDGTTVWVRRFNDEAPDRNLLVILSTVGLEFTLGSNKLILQNIKIMKATISTANKDALRIWGSPNSTFIADNCAYCLGSKNGLATINVDNVYQFNCTSHSNAIDGMNYHGLGGANPTEFVFEYNCHSYNNGTINYGTHNATTAHDGMTVLRVGSVGYDCYGPILADVNGCYSVNIDCTMYNSLMASGQTKAAFYFDEAAAAKQGKAYLINCGGGGTDTYSISSDGNVDIYVKNFRGKNINSNTRLNFL